VADKKSLRQFGLRTLLLFVAVAALGCLLLRNEMTREERREKLLAELEAQGTSSLLFLPSIGPPPPLWRQPMAAWLRGKPMVPPRWRVTFTKGTSLEQMREFLDLFPTVRHVQIDGDDATKEVLQLLAAHGPYDFLRFQNLLVIDKEKAQQIAQIRCNEGVGFRNQESSDDALMNLANAGVTVDVYLGDDWWRNVGDEGLKAVAKLPKIRIVLANCLGTDEGVRALAGHPSITSLSLNGPHYTDATTDVILSLPRLQQVSFSGTSHTDAGLAKAITGCPARTINLHNVDVGEQTIAALASASGLTHLTFRDVDLSTEQCNALAKLPLGSLELHGKSFTDDHIAQLAPFAKALNHIVLDTPQVTDAGLSWLKGAKNITGLRLDNTQATADLWSSLPYLGAIEHVGMGGGNFDAETIGYTSKMPKLSYIALTGSRIDDATLELLPPDIPSIALLDTRVTPEGLKKLATRKGMIGITVVRDSDPVSYVEAADVKDAQAVAGPGVVINFEEASAYRCE
jgi:hypothetical protein